MKRSAEDRFWEKVTPVGECLIWTGFITSFGHGHFNYKGKMVNAHRYAYETRVGPIPPGTEIDHLCHNPSCVCPGHLEAVSHRVNMMRGLKNASARAARRSECAKGHPLSGENVRYHSHRDGYRRVCVICLREKLKAQGVKRKRLRLSAGDLGAITGRKM